MSTYRTGTAGLRAAGRPSSTVLTQDRITQAAMGLLKKRGELTMATLARELKVAVSSLYNHVGSRDEVLANISDAVVREITLKPLERAVKTLESQALSTVATEMLWIEAVRQWAYSYREAFAATPELIPYLAVTPIRQAPQTLAMYEQLVKAFTAFGFRPGEALTTIESIEAFLLGSALDAGAPHDIFSPAEHGQEHPALSVAYKELFDICQEPADHAFESGLQALLLRFSAWVRSVGS